MTLPLLCCAQSFSCPWGWSTCGPHPDWPFDSTHRHNLAQLYAVLLVGGCWTSATTWIPEAVKAATEEARFKKKKIGKQTDAAECAYRRNSFIITSLWVTDIQIHIISHYLNRIVCGPVWLMSFTPALHIHSCNDLFFCFLHSSRTLF